MSHLLILKSLILTKENIADLLLKKHDFEY